MNMLILGIETSCDDTCASIVEAKGGLRRPRFKVLSNVVSSQVKVHQKYGGVVPTLAAREHAKNIKPVLKRAFQGTGYRIQDINLIAVTTHPGLLPALLVGVHSARTIAWWLGKPILGIDHLEAHLVANLLPPQNNAELPRWPSGEPNAKQRRTVPRGSAYNSAPALSEIEGWFCDFPAIGLVVSGGHTQLVLMRGFGKTKIIGETRDDAAGEAFDKVAKMLKLPFPGGPAIQQLAAEWKSKAQNPNAKSNPKSKIQNIQITLPRPMIHSGDFDFSFSGLKTAVLYTLRDLGPAVFAESRGNKRRQPQKRLYAAVAAEFQQAVVDVLVAKTIRAAKQYKAKTVMLGGGVAANLELRKQLGETLKKELPSIHYSLPTTHFAVDNAAMIAATAYIHWLKGERKTWKQIKVRA